MECMRKDCHKEGTYTLSFQARPFGYQGMPIDGIAGIRVCREHATEDSADECMKSGVMKSIQDMCKQRHVKPPDEYRCGWVSAGN